MLKVPAIFMLPQVCTGNDPSPTLSLEDKSKHSNVALRVNRALVKGVQKHVDIVSHDSPVEIESLRRSRNVLPVDLHPDAVQFIVFEKVRVFAPRFPRRPNCLPYPE